MADRSPTLGVCYYPEHWPRDMWEHDAARMVECGITVVRIGEFSWSRIEPSRDDFQFEWLDDAVEVLAKAGLNIVMGTPTATPPKWLVDEMPDMVAVDAQGNPRKFGSRRHYDFSHIGFRVESRRITEIFAKRYGEHPAIIAWQTDNEYGCHDTTMSYSDAARDGFRVWLAARYGTVDALNEAWGNIFWSMELASFEDAELPNLTVTEPNPAHVLDFRRYSSDQVVAFNREQVDIIRAHSPGRDVLHNFMQHYTEFDHFDVSVDLDVATWDSYPIGMLERHGRDAAWKNWYMRAGDPDSQAFHHDLYRACGRVKDRSQAGRMWVMEQQPGPVNWAPWNPDPHPGMVRLWTHEAIAHGAEVVSYFRWRQAPFAQEQFHAGLLRPDDTEDRGYDEAAQVALELADLPKAQTTRAKVALVFDYASIWATEIQPQGADYDGFTLALEWYSALRRQGQNIDIVRPGEALDGYSAVFVPHLLMVSDKASVTFENCDGHIVFGSRTGSRTEHHRIPDGLPPGPLRALIDIKINRVESLRPAHCHLVGNTGSLVKWAEQVEAGRGVDVIAETAEGHPARLRQGKVDYIAGWPDESLLDGIISDTLDRAGIERIETGDDLRVRDRGNLRTIVNYGPKPRDTAHLIPSGAKVLVGEATLGVAGVAIVELP
ncbi:beta-galactosidase [Ahrensia sp. R2A130]|uniref:beta-galactosidase n=1 Tax=Ahrensia sp. R2A130 TaxID=744979 RepID=UPI0001E083F0|nr:beta-galactosidase [Ahrensia sp. R2A130]EFL89239.1 beta-galactosidase [Ahrensia sp. R2A130]